MNAVDAVVVGGGPAGSSAALGLVRQGLDVVVLDKASFPRDKVCAGWITPEVVDALGLDLADYARGRVLQPIHAFGVGVLGAGEVETRRSQRPVSYGIRRRELDHYLLERSGALLRLGEAVRELRRDGDVWRINGDLRARLLIGAGGHFCPVARRLGARVGRRETAVVAQEVEFELGPEQAASCRLAPEIPWLLFCPDLRGYGWVFRKEGWLNVGLGRQDPRRLSAHVAAFRRRMIAAGRVPPSCPESFQGHAYRLTSQRPRRVLGDGVLLVGDAAGLAHPKSGEGIRPAVESGLLAAELAAAANGDYRASRLEPYVDALKEYFGFRARDVGDLGDAGEDEERPGFLERFLARRLFRTEWFARRVVQDRWFLNRHRHVAAAITPGHMTTAA